MQETGHEIRHSVQVDEPYFRDRFDMLQCQACHRVSLRQLTNIKDEIAYAERPYHFGMARAEKALLAGMLKFLSERGELKLEALPAFWKKVWDDVAVSPDRHKVVTQFYPSGVSRRYPDWAIEIGAELSQHEGLAEIFYEVYVAANNELTHLALMGVRSILEKVMISKVGDSGRFITNLEKFREAGLISLLEFDHLQEILEASHAVIHRGFGVTEWDLNTALGIMENILSSLYIYPERVNELSMSVPPRPRGRKPPNQS
jgi:hypothetical protein